MLMGPYDGRVEHHPIQVGRLQGLKGRFPHAFWAKRRKRRQTELNLPNRSGRSAHGQPVRIIHTIALKKRRLSLAVTPQSVTLPDKRGAMAAHCWSVIS